MKRRAAMATATAASMADSKPTRDRKRSARSRVDCICGLPDSSDSMRTPLMACVLIWLSSQA
ncbi:hypothetical protein D3C72_2042430 [compost metagenome]